MVKKNVSINMLIRKAIIASTSFDAQMDSIDFDTNIPSQIDQVSINEQKIFTSYFDKISKAQNLCEDIINQLDKIGNIKEKEEKEYPLNLVSTLIETKKASQSNKQKTRFANYYCQYLIWQLFTAKIIRIDGRKQANRKKEVEYYQRAKQILNSAFNTIEQGNFINNQKKKKFTDNYNWAKILYYNELSICYSGLAESSMSLGYAEESYSLLNILYHNNSENYMAFDGKKQARINDVISSFQILNLYTFALYNKGEAERNLHDDDKALRTFHKIVEIWSNKNKRSSDYYMALLRIGTILIDQGRSEEAIAILRKISLPKNDVRRGSRDLEIASAYIDQKEYVKAYTMELLHLSGQ
jgi:tetratricopeptide (TPR) repeat protein